jgi:hypothetical protein
LRDAELAVVPDEIHDFELGGGQILDGAFGHLLLSGTGWRGSTYSSR